MRAKYRGKGRLNVTLSEKGILDLKLNRKTLDDFVERARVEQKARTERKAKILPKPHQKNAIQAKKSGHFWWPFRPTGIGVKSLFRI